MISTTAIDGGEALLNKLAVWSYMLARSRWLTSFVILEGEPTLATRAKSSAHRVESCLVFGIAIAVLYYHFSMLASYKLASSRYDTDGTVPLPE